MNDFKEGFLKGYKAAVEDATSRFFANMDIYNGFTSSGVFTYFLKNINMEDFNEEGKLTVYSFQEYLEECLNDWLLSHYAAIKRDFEEEEDYGDCQNCVHAVPKDNGRYFCSFYGLDMHHNNTREDYQEKIKYDCRFRNNLPY